MCKCVSQYFLLSQIVRKVWGRRFKRQKSEVFHLHNMQRPTTAFIYLRTEIERNLKSEKKLGNYQQSEMQRCSHGLLWMDTNQLGSGHGCGRTHKERSTTTTFVDPMHKKAREKENAPTLYWDCDLLPARVSLFHWKSWNLAHAGFTFVLRLWPPSNDDCWWWWCRPRKSPATFPCAEVGHTSNSNTLWLTDGLCAGACISHNQSPLHLTN
jgi:hypothetical protein